MKSREAILPVLALFFLSCRVLAQPIPNAECKLDPPAFNTSAPNIFNDRQEQDLGDALAEYFESDMRIAPPAADDQLTQIGEKLLATLPPTGIHYRFRIYDSGEVNGFSVAGGRVYISRKLIAAIKNEDQLAGVLAHELGHLSTHQTATVITRIFRIRLGVTQVTDRADIFAKVHKMFATPAKRSEDEDTEEKNQLVADHVALYAMIRVGYAAESFASFMNESMMNKGETGNWITDIFGLTHEEARRYRSALKLIDALPIGCRGKQPVSGEAFRAWLKGTVNERIKDVAEGVSGDRQVKLDPPLRPPLWRIHFSPDGRHVLAQDEASITVVDKDAGKVLFRFDAPGANAAYFTPDSASVAFIDSNLRVERWSVATNQRTSVNEMVVYDGCNQFLLSLDAKTLVCANVNVHDQSARISLRLIDVESGKVFFEKPTFLDTFEFTYASLLFFEAEALADRSLVAMTISPDNHYLLVAGGRETLAYDLELRQPVALKGKLKELVQTAMSFVGPDELYVTGANDGKGAFAAEVLSFPDGRLIKETKIGPEEIGPVTKGRFIQVSPLKGYAVGILDPIQERFLAVGKLPAIDAWDSWIAMEDAVGRLQIGQFSAPDIERVALPLGPLPSPRAAVFSPDGKYLAVSVRDRAAVWDLETGKQMSLLRPFRSAWIDKSDQLIGQFPKYSTNETAELQITLNSMAYNKLAGFGPDDWQYHDLQFHFKPMGKEKTTSRHATLEVKKMGTAQVAWSRDYPRETPACWPAEDDRMVLAWDWSVDAAKSEIKSYPGLQRQAEALKNAKKGLLIETVTPETGSPLEQVIIPEADLTHGWDDIRRAQVSGEFVLVRGEHSNTAIYRLDSGAKVGEFFGVPVATDAATGLIAARNRENEILLVDENTGKELKRFTLGSPVLVAGIVTGTEKALLVLTSDQVVHRLPLPG